MHNDHTKKRYRWYVSCPECIRSSRREYCIVTLKKVLMGLICNCRMAIK